MATEKVTLMVLKVDLHCPSCFKKAKKTLCKFPQVRDQIYDDKSNTVTIKVVCCSPEKIRDKLCCEGGRSIKSITIKEPAKPDKPKKPKDDPPDNPKEKEKPQNWNKPKDAEKPQNGNKPNDAGKPQNGNKPKDAEKPNGNAEKPKSGDGGPPAGPKPSDMPKTFGPGPGPIVLPYLAQQMKGPDHGPAQGVPSVFPYVGPRYNGYASVPYGYPGPPQSIYHEEVYYDYGHVQGYGSDRAAVGNRCESFYGNENPQICSIM